MTIGFDKRLAELDAYLQMLIEQTETLDKKLELASNDAERDGLLLIKNNLESLLGSIKHSIVLLQIAKVSIRTNPPTPPQRQQRRQQRQLSQSQSPSVSEVGRRSIQEGRASVARGPQARLGETSFRHQAVSANGASSFGSENCANGASIVVAAIRDGSMKESSSPSNIVVVHNNREDQQNCDIAYSGRVRGSGAGAGASYDNDNDGGGGGGGDGDDEEDDDDEAFYDAADVQHSNTPRIANSASVPPLCNRSSKSPPSALDQSINTSYSNESDSSLAPTMPNQAAVVGVNDDVSVDWDALYEEEEEDLGSLENQGSVIKHLISQIRIGMDLTKVVLPTFILERRSLLEMYADFFAHPDLFSSIPDYETPEERMVQLVKWYLSAFHVGRKSSVAKKPYNPILGEIFLCHWSLNSGQDKDEAKGPECNTARKSQTEFKNELSKQNESNNNVNNSESDGSPNLDRTSSTESTSSSAGDIEKFSKNLPNNSLLFVAEQVSHHPPVSAFYAENPEKAISCCSHIYTKSKYLGLSVGVHNLGEGVISLLKHNERYICTFPSAYGRSILTVPWVELGGSVTIDCPESGYSASIEFVMKPFYGGRKHRVMGEILRPNKEPFMTIDGEWNGVMYSKCPPNSNDKQVFVDTTCLPVIKKHVRSISTQESFESRNVWKEVTRALKLRDVASATAAKSFIEQRQRDLLKDRMEKGVKWKTRYFEAVDDGWTYAKPLADRLSSTTT